MSAVSFTGLATGMDTASLMSQLVELKRVPIYRLESQKSGYQNQVSVCQRSRCSWNPSPKNVTQARCSPTGLLTETNKNSP